MNAQVLQLARRLPGVHDRALLELANGIGVARAITADRAESGVIARLIADFTGNSQRAQLLTIRHLVNGQETLAALAVETSEYGRVTDLAIARVAGYLKSVKEQALTLQRTHEELADEVGEIIKATDERFSLLERRVDKVELKDAARDFGDQVLAGAERSLRGVPWPYQAILLGRHLASGPCGRWYAESGDTQYRNRIARTVADSIPYVSQAPRRTIGLANEFEEAWRMLAWPEQRALLGELLDVGLVPGLAMASRPLNHMAAMTMELASLPDDVRPERPARIALELSRRRVDYLDAGATARRIVDVAVHEQFELAASHWRRP
ncbi:hypothetical protein [Streptomyces mirabilis]|uniref:hypothetical protein n=1 Tax=Streptomyces mirabilis TaxID=68239 RepID=UPI00369B280B